jgi:hypothetical protein
VSWYNTVYREVMKKKRTSNYQYSILEHTPYLHGPEQLETMRRNAVNDYQKAAIMNHIMHFEKHTMPYDSYRKIYNSIWDEYR